jgi:hypothetical protein
MDRGGTFNHPSHPDWKCRRSNKPFETVIASHRVGAKRRPMTGSAKQSISPRKESMDCFVAEFIIGPAEGRTRWLLAMTLP